MTKPDAPPVIEKFILYGLNGYKTIELDTPSAAKIISAENGTGKTTVLNALYGVLSRKYVYLNPINFRRLEIKFSGHEMISATRGEIMGTVSGAIASLPKSLLGFFTSYQQSEDDLLNLVEAFKLDTTENNPLFRNLWLVSPYSKDEIRSKLSEVSEFLSNKNDPENSFSAKIKDALSGYKVLYFPTYRRIEAEIPEYNSLRPEGPRSLERNKAWDDGKLINFGLHDVQLRLNGITNDIRKGTLEAYAKISGRTLDQLVSVIKLPPSDTDSYNVSAIKVVLGRIGKSNTETEKSIIDLIESGKISSNEHEYLRYFISQMVEVYREMQLQENTLEKFVSIVQDYWRGNNEKTFVFDNVSAEASVTNNITGKKLNLNALSSGEQQIISVFAKLYLELTQKYIVLIDEPELSLSMEWQKKFLPDILEASSCSQLIAITHSPFVFENSLDPFAGPLKVSFSEPEVSNADE